MDVKVFNKSDITYLNEMLLDENGRLNIVPYDYLKDVPQDHIMQFCVEQGFYSIPTIELMTFLKNEIGDQSDKAIEIGAGNGVISRTLGIRGTDNYMQANPKIKAYYETLQQATVPYGNEVENIDANSAVQKYKPSIVIGAWCTHKYNPTEHWREGNEFGIDEKKILRKVDKYIHIGNEKIHGKKPILKQKPSRIIKEDWILSRSQHSKQNVIWIWEK
jgi:hypothetical protein